MIAGNMNKATVSGMVDQLNAAEAKVKNLRLAKSFREAALKEARRLRTLLGWDDLPSYNKPALA